MLITEEYRKMQKKLHCNENYGSTGESYADLINGLISKYQFKEILDYGAGKCRLKDSIESKVLYTPYEPSNPLWADTPSPCEFVTCIDVLEHIEPECLDDVLDDLKRLVKRLGFFTIHTGAAQKILPDGRNAHLTQEPWEWWERKLSNRFDIVRHLAMNNGIVVLVKYKE